MQVLLCLVKAKINLPLNVTRKLASVLQYVEVSANFQFILEAHMIIS